MRNNYFYNRLIILDIVARKRYVLGTKPNIYDGITVEVRGFCLIKHGIRYGDLRVRILELDLYVIAFLQKRSLEEIHLRRSDKARNEFIARIIVQIFRGIDLLHESVFHNNDPRSHCHCFYLIVRDVNKCRLKFTVQFADFRSHLRPEFCVQIRQRFVQKHHFGFAYDRASERNALSLSAGHFLRLFIEIFGNTEDIRRFDHFSMDFIFRKFTKP